jgi:hypothetical protein
MNAVFLLASLMAGQIPPKDNPQVGGIESRKESRDKVLATVGQDALPFTKSFGDLGVEALAACDPEVGKGIVRLFGAGDLAKLNNQRAMLNAIRNHGTPAAAWLIQHHEQLEDPVSLGIWCRAPMEFVYDLRDIELETTRMKETQRLREPWLTRTYRDGNIGYVIAGVVGVVFLIFFFRRPRAAA